MSDPCTEPQVTSSDLGGGQMYNNLRIIKDWKDVHPIILGRLGKADCPVAAAPQDRTEEPARVRAVCGKEGQTWERQWSVAGPRESKLLCSLQSEPLHDPVSNLNTLRRSQAKVDLFLQDCKGKPSQQRWEKRLTRPEGISLGIHQYDTGPEFLTHVGIGGLSHVYLETHSKVKPPTWCLSYRWFKRGQFTT